MDTLSHGLWVFGICKLLKYCRNKKINPWKTALYATLPDIISFSPLIFYGLYLLITMHFPFSDLQNFSLVYGKKEWTAWQLSHHLYLIMHSLIIMISFLIITRKKELGIGWGSHIVIDAFTHNSSFNPILFLWPLSSYYIEGIAWMNPYFLAINWIGLGILYGYLWLSKLL